MFTPLSLKTFFKHSCLTIQPTYFCIWCPGANYSTVWLNMNDLSKNNNLWMMSALFLRPWNNPTWLFVSLSCDMLIWIEPSQEGVQEGVYRPLQVNVTTAKGNTVCRSYQMNDFYPFVTSPPYKQVGMHASQNITVQWTWNTQEGVQASCILSNKGDDYIKYFEKDLCW